MVVAVDDNIPLLADALACCAEVRIFSGRSLERDLLADAEVLFVRSTTKVNEQLLSGTAVRFVGTATAGTDHIDEHYLARRGIPWISAAGCNAASVAEYVVYAALCWAERHERSLRDAVIGIVGYGHVGSRVGSLAHRLGMQVLANDPPLTGHRGGFPEYCRQAELSELVEASDIITLHVPLVRTGRWPTEQLLCGALLQHAKPGGLIVQASRGGVVDEAGLLPLLEAGRVDAAVDVWEHEPVPDERLVRLCMLATPHIAGHSYEGKLRGSAAMAAAFVEWTGLQPDMDNLDRAFDSAMPPALNYADEKHLLELLRERRRLYDDDRFLRSLLALPPKERGRQFDSFRSNYPVRRETLL